MLGAASAQYGNTFSLCNCFLLFSIPYVWKQNTTGGHMWVMTRNADGGTTFWEALSGIRYNVPRSTSSSSSSPPTFPVIPQKAIHCIFNDKAFYANNQVLIVYLSVNPFLSILFASFSRVCRRTTLSSIANGNLRMLACGKK